MGGKLREGCPVLWATSVLLLGLLFGGYVWQVRLLLWGTRTVAVGHLMPGDAE